MMTREGAIRVVAPIIERMESRHPEHVIAAAVVDALGIDTPDPELERLRAVEQAARELVETDCVLHASAPAETWRRYTAAIQVMRAVLSGDERSTGGS